MTRITVTDVAKRLGKDPNVVRTYIRAGLYPFAVAVQMPGRKHWDYTIFPGKFEEYCNTGGKPDISKLIGGADDVDEKDNYPWPSATQ